MFRSLSERGRFCTATTPAPIHLFLKIPVTSLPNLALLKTAFSLTNNVSMLSDHSLLTTLLSPLYYFYELFAAMLRKLISSPRNRHSDPLSSTSLDLAYLTPNLIVMSTPASTFPKTLWRNPTEDVRKFLDANHPGKWRVWSLRGEGHDYLDHDLDGKGIPISSGLV